MPARKGTEGAFPTHASVSCKANMSFWGAEEAGEGGVRTCCAARLQTSFPRTSLLRHSLAAYLVHVALWLQWEQKICFPFNSDF